MQRISTSSAVADLFGSGKAGFRNGDLPRGVLPTAFNAEWCNHVQEEICNVIEGAGVALNPDKRDQLLAALKKLIDEQAAGKGLPVGAVIGFPRAVRNPAGYLRADGTTFEQNTFPDLYRALGNSNRLPDLSRTDIGITAWFPSDRIPTGWLAFDDIRTRVTETAYPELYRLLVAKYGSIQNVPQAEDRFIRNAGNGLAVGTKQGDAIRNITGKIDSGNRSNEQLFDTAIPEGAFGIDKARKNWTYDAGDGGNDRPSALTFDASRVVPTADENRPKALVLKLCIKAADTLGEAVFWIKSHGTVSNAGALDAGTLAQGLQDKADRDHTHTAAQIQGLDEKISAAMGGIFGNSAAATGWQKLPGGILIQWGKNNINGVHRSNTVYFPVSFGEVWSISTATHTPNSSFYGNMAAGVTIRNYSESSLVIDYHSCYETAGGSGVSVSWIAIGKAASGNAAGTPASPGVSEIDEVTRRAIEEALAGLRR